jgi:hypothetical protein
VEGREEHMPRRHVRGGGRESRFNLKELLNYARTKS